MINIKNIGTIILILVVGYVLYKYLFNKSKIYPTSVISKIDNVLINSYISKDEYVSNMNTIHQIWIGDEMPQHRILYCSSVKKFSEYCNYKYILWTNQSLTKQNFPVTYDLIQEIKKYNGGLAISDLIKNKKCRKNKTCHKNKAIQLLTKLSKHIPNTLILNKFINIPRLSKWSQIGDLMKFELINTHGGIYFDTNIEIKENKFKDLKMEFENKDLVCSSENKGILSPGLFASKKNNLALTDMLNNIDSINYLSGRANFESGPAFFGYYIRKNISKPYIIPIRKIYPYISWGSNATKDLTIHKKRKLNTKPINYKGKKYYLSFPCPKHIYPNAYTIDHFEFGKTW